MATEIELKFDLEPQSRRKLAAATALAGTNPRRTTMRSLYFDTPDRSLAKREMALRLRREGRRWVQTLKAGHSGTGGLHDRDEWEHVRPGPTLDLSLLEETPLARLAGPKDLQERLGPVFEVRVTRTTWRVAPEPGSRLEVAFDSGEVASGEKTAPICEVEIECLEGDPARAFDLAAKLMQEVELHPSAISKAQRGYRLSHGGPLQPVKSSKVELHPSITTVEAARVVIGAGIEQLQANEEGVLAGDDPEFVHQARVALRRSRSAIRMFRQEIGESRAREWLDALGETSRALGRARDWDVFATRSIPAVLAAFADASLSRSIRAKAARRRGIERDKAREALRSPRYAAALLEIARWLARADGAQAPQAAPEALMDFAARYVRKRQKGLLGGALALSTMGIQDRHRVRILAKRLRYGLEALSTLYKARPLEAYLASVESLQEALGNGNDASVALEMLKEIAPPEPFASYARGWFAARERVDAAMLEPIVVDLSRHRQSWLKEA
ncbi:MAG TPA: CHAD domain-containing protein [Usitatibacter sp.]|nr:CHAD domain-containing protein [Usitatibacter sp.]